MNLPLEMKFDRLVDHTRHLSNRVFIVTWLVKTFAFQAKKTSVLAFEVGERAGAEVYNLVYFWYPRSTQASLEGRGYQKWQTIAKRAIPFFIIVFTLFGSQSIGSVFWVVTYGWELEKSWRRLLMNWTSESLTVYYQRIMFTFLQKFRRMFQWVILSRLLKGDLLVKFNKNFPISESSIGDVIFGEEDSLVQQAAMLPMTLSTTILTITLMPISPITSPISL